MTPTELYEWAKDRRLGVDVEKSTRYDLVEAEEGFYRIDGLSNISKNKGR